MRPRPRAGSAGATTIAMVRLRNTISSSTNATIMITVTASGAVPVSAAVRSWFCAAGPPTSAPGTLVWSWPRRRPTRSEVCWSSTAVLGVTRMATRPFAAGWRGDAGVGHVRVCGSRSDHCRCVSGGGGDEDRRGGAWPERGGDHVVSVATGRALVDDVRAGHAEPHPERGAGQQQQQREPGGQCAARPLQRHPGPARPPALGAPVGILVFARPGRDRRAR